MERRTPALVAAEATIAAVAHRVVRAKAVKTAVVGIAGAMLAELLIADLAPIVATREMILNPRS